MENRKWNKKKTQADLYTVTDNSVTLQENFNKITQ